MEHTNASLLIPDYVLDLLPADKRQLVEFHAAGCPACRQAIQRERQVGQAVRDTLFHLPRPAAARLSQLQPAYYRPRPFFTASRQLAALALMVCLLLGTVGLNQANSRPDWPVQSPTVLVATETATATTMPTSTEMMIDQSQPTAVQKDPVATVALNNAPSPAAVPNPAATPEVTLVVFSN